MLHCVYEYYTLFIHPSIDTYILAVVNNVAENIRLFFLTNFCLFELLLSFPMDKYPEVELWDYVIVLFLIFWGNSILFSILAISTSVPINSVQGFLLLHILANACHFLSFWWQLVCMWGCNSLWVWLTFYLTISDV